MVITLLDFRVEHVFYVFLLGCLLAILASGFLHRK